MSTYCFRVEDPSPIEQAADYLRYATGIRVPGFRRPILESVLKRLGGGQAGVRRLVSDPSALREMIHEITVPETYCFRHPGHFRALAELARERRAAGRPCRVLAAGCSTGEEAWSAAAVLARIGGSGRPELSVEGWELDDVRVRRARRGELGESSARRGLAGYEAYFERRPQGGFRVHDRLRSRVRFREVNLARELPGHQSWDAILLRNVSIYWDEETTRRVVEGLLGRLSGDGLFLLGPSDPVVLRPRRWRIATVDGAPVYRRRLSAREAPRSGHGRLLSFPAPTGNEGARPEKAVPSTAGASAWPPWLHVAGDVVPVCSFPPESRHDVWLGQAMAKAAAGNYTAALELIRRRPAKPSAGARLLEGTLLLDLGATDEAVRRLRQAVVLAPEDPTCRRGLAVGLEALGRTFEAEREQRHAFELEAV